MQARTLLTVPLSKEGVSTAAEGVTRIAAPVAFATTAGLPGSFRCSLSERYSFQELLHGLHSWELRDSGILASSASQT